MKKILFISLGCITFTLGTIGIFVPFMPTTGFYLATAFLWMRSSDRLYQQFINSTFYQQNIERVLFKREITTKGMLKMFASMLVVFAVPFILVPNFWVRVIVASIYLAHVIGLSLYFKWDTLFGKNKVEESLDD